MTQPLKMLIFANRWGGWSYVTVHPHAKIYGRARWLWLAKLKVKLFHPDAIVEIQL